MERTTFDQFTRLFATTRNRRSTLRLVATAALLGGAATLDSATAKSHKKRGKVRSEAVSDECRDVPLICRTTSSGGCGQPQGNCANKKIGPGTNLTNCNFVTDQDVVETNFASANLTGTCWLADELFNRPNFRGANLTNACFFETDLSFSDFRGANLQGASFCHADLTGANFRGSNLTAEQLASAGRFACTTILPNGKPAVTCAAGQTCNTEFGVCTCQQDSDCTVTGIDCLEPGCLNGFCVCFL